MVSRAMGLVRLSVSPMLQRVAHIVGMRPISQIAQVIVLRISVVVADIHPVWVRSDERNHDEGVNVPVVARVPWPSERNLQMRSAHGLARQDSTSDRLGRPLSLIHI